MAKRNSAADREDSGGSESDSYRAGEVRNTQCSKGTTRRELLAAAIALPGLSILRPAPAYAEHQGHRAPSLELERVIAPGLDDFPEEKIAQQIETSMHNALRSGNLPGASSIRGVSPCATSFRSIASDLQESVYDTSDAAVNAGWQRWVQSLGTIRRAEFDSLPDGVIRFAIASERDRKLLYRTGLWRLRGGDTK